MNLDLLSPAVEIGLVTTNLEAMVGFYEGFLGLEPQGEIESGDGSQRRYMLGGSVIKLVTYDTPPPQPAVPGGGRAQAGLRYFTSGSRTCATPPRRSRRRVTRSSSRPPSSLPFLEWAGCSSPIPTATRSSCSARCDTFRMTIEDVFTIRGRGTVVTGRVESGAAAGR